MLGNLKLLLLQRDFAGILPALILPMVIAYLLLLRSRRTWGRERVYLPDRTKHIADVVGYPVNQYGKGEADA